MKGTVLMDRAAMERAVTRIAYEILEKNKGLDNLVLIGIQRRGVVLAQEIAAKFKALEGAEVPVGILDITLYRDDLSLLNAHPVINGTDIEFDVTGKKIVLVDDVLFTGRTVRCAIDAIIELGRPQLIQLAIMIDRGHREFPFRADYVGKNVPTAKSEVIHVCVDAFDGDTCVILEDTEDEA